MTANTYQQQSNDGYITIELLENDARHSYLNEYKKK